MSIYEAVGSIWVILTCTLGTATIGGLALYGGYRMLECLMIGKTYEDAAVRDLLEHRRSEIPGVITE